MDQYGMPELPLPESYGKVPIIEFTLANTSVRATIATQKLANGLTVRYTSAQGRVLALPDLTKTAALVGIARPALEAAHVRTKAQVAERRRAAKADQGGNRPEPRNLIPSAEEAATLRRGKPGAQSTIIAAKDLYESVLVSAQLVANNPDTDEKQRLEYRLLPAYYLGDWQYRKGEWAEAESSWLSILPQMAARPGIKLAIMYRKQHRYRDEVAILEQAIEAATGNPWYAEVDELTARLSKAEAFYQRHALEDVSGLEDS